MPLQKLTFKALVENCLNKPGFFQGLKKDPINTLKNAGLAPTPQILTALQALDYNDIQNVAMACDPLTGPLC